MVGARPRAASSVGIFGIDPRADAAAAALPASIQLYGLLLTFGLALIIQGLFQNYFGVVRHALRDPRRADGGFNLGFMFLPVYRGWVVVVSLVVCFATWF